MLKREWKREMNFSQKKSQKGDFMLSMTKWAREVKNLRNALDSKSLNKSFPSPQLINFMIHDLVN